MRLQKADWVWTDRQHFLAIAARAMRQILVERARARGAQKRWAGLNRTTLSETLAAAAHHDAILPDLDEALSRLEEIDHEQALIIELRYFVGLSVEETADAIGLSPPPSSGAGRWRAPLAVSRADRHGRLMRMSRWQRVCDLFERALEEQPADLDTWLEREAPDDPDVRDEVRSLLQHDSRANHFLSEPAPDPDPSGPEDDNAYEPGHVLGTYTIVRELGRGGMGRVYLAHDARLNRDVALKAIAPRFIGDPAHRERLQREARAAAKLTHPGICTVYALEEFDGELFIASSMWTGRRSATKSKLAGGRLAPRSNRRRATSRTPWHRPMRVGSSIAT
jgi:hypothetical protein